MSKYAKAISVLVLGAVAALLDELGADVPGETLEQVVGAIVTAATVYLVPNE